MVHKVRKELIYAQNLYAALCNNQYTPLDAWGILANIKWDCTWSYAANMIAEIREKEEARKYYCSGSKINQIDLAGFVEESYVTEEIESDFTQIGWVLVTRRFI